MHISTLYHHPSLNAISLLILGLAALQPAQIQASEVVDQAALAGERAGDVLLRNEQENSLLQFDPSSSSWRYTIRRRDGTERTDEVRATEMTPGGSPMDAWQDNGLADLQSLTVEELEAAGQTRKQSLSVEQSPYGEAYRAMRAGAGRQPNLVDDPNLWGQTDTVRSRMSAITGEFGGCTLERENQPSGEIHSKTVEFRTCERYTALSRCDKSREIETAQQTGEVLNLAQSGLTRPYDHVVNMQEVVPPGFELADVVADLNWNGNVSNVDMDPPWVGNGWQLRVSVQLDPSQFTCADECTVNDPGCSCELTGSEQHVEIVVNAVSTGIRATTATEPAGCLEATDGFCAAQWTCLDNAPRTIDGVVIGAHNAQGLPLLYPTGPGNSPPSSQEPFCWAARASYDCSFNIGSAGCWTTPSGDEVCHENLPGATMPPVAGVTADTCDAVANGLACGEYASECAWNAKGHGDYCYVSSVTLACETAYTTEDVKTTESFVCGNDTSLRCLGDDCLVETKDSRPDPLGASQTMVRASHKALQHMHTDYSYVDDSQTAVWTMAGIPLHCRKGLGSELDLCNVQLEDGSKEYLEIVDVIARVDGGLATYNQALASWYEPDTGSALALRDEANHRWDVVGNRLLVTTAENVMGMSEIEELLGGAWGRVRDAYGTEAADFIYGVQPSMIDTRSSLYRAKQAHDIGAETEPPEDWMGTTGEYVLARSRSIGACLHVGGYCKRNGDQPLNACAEYHDAYCCYDSHIARILHEHADEIAGLAVGGHAGDPEAPQCPGFTSLPDGSGFTQIPITEIIGWEARAGRAPSPDDIDYRMSPQQLTGSSSTLGPGSRQPFNRRIQARLDPTQVDVDRVRSRVTAELGARVEGDVGETDGVGRIDLSPRVVTAQPGDRVRVGLYRHGSEGEVSVRLRGYEEDVTPGYFFPMIDQVITWSDGESGFKFHVHETFPAMPWHQAFTLQAELRLEDPTGGVIIAEGAGTGRLTLVHRGSQ